MIPIARLAAVAATILVAGCASRPPRLMVETRIERPPLPMDLLSCAPEPEPPGTSRDGAVALYLARLWAAGNDCRQRLAEVRGLMTAPP